MNCSDKHLAVGVETKLRVRSVFPMQSWNKLDRVCENSRLTSKSPTAASPVFTAVFQKSTGILSAAVSIADPTRAAIHSADVLDGFSRYVRAKAVSRRR